ncbi:MAG: DUF177 domain-containing protein [Cyclobacteriaceae bacterium]|nr:DUF177 domain-containing protein [Cyclobacteriaceae bacterium]
MKAFRVNILGLSLNVHQFEYELGDEFFREYGSDLISKGSFHVSVALNKHETFIEADFDIKGKVKLICDRSLEPFDYPIDTNQKIVFKYGDHDEEITEEIVMIQRDTVTLELGHYIYEFIGLSIPMKRLHPKFQQEDDEYDGGIIYSSETASENDNKDEIDPRWEILKKLK